MFSFQIAYTFDVISTWTTTTTYLLHVCLCVHWGQSNWGGGDFFFPFDLLLWFLRACFYIIQVSQRWESFFFLKRIMYTRQKTRTMAAVERIIFKTGKEPVVPADVFPIYLRTIVIIFVQNSLYSRFCMYQVTWLAPATQLAEPATPAKQQTTTIFIFKAQLLRCVLDTVARSVHLRLWERYDAPAIWSKSFIPFFLSCDMTKSQNYWRFFLISVPIVL